MMLYSSLGVWLTPLSYGISISWTNRDLPIITVKQSRVSTLKEKKHPCSEDEWERILTEVLLDRQSDPEIEAAAHVEPDESVTLIVRRSISGIKVYIPTHSMYIIA